MADAYDALFEGMSEPASDTESPTNLQPYRATSTSPYDALFEGISDEPKQEGIFAWGKKGLADLMDYLTITSQTPQALGAGDFDEELVADSIADINRRAEIYRKSEGHKRIMAMMEKEGKEWDEAEGFWETSKETIEWVGNAVLGAVSEPQGMAEFTAGQLPMALPGWGGAFLGFISPVPGGAYAGMGAGEFAVETGAAVFEAMRHRGVDTTDRKAVLDTLNNTDVLDELYKEGMIKGGTIAAFGMFGLGLQSFVAKRLGRKLAKDLMNAGVTKPLNKGGMAQALSLEAGGNTAVRAAFKSFADASTQGRRVALGAGMTVSEVLTEGAGEGFGQKFAWGEVDPTEVGLEMLGAVGQSVVQSGVVQGLSGTNKLRKSVVRKLQAKAVSEGKDSGIKPEDINEALALQRDAIKARMVDIESDMPAWEEVLAEADTNASVSELTEQILELEGIDNYRRVLHKALEDTLPEDTVPLYVALNEEEQATVAAGGRIGRAIRGSLNEGFVNASSDETVVAVRVPITSIVGRGNWNRVELIATPDGIQFAKVPKAETTAKEAEAVEADVGAALDAEAARLRRTEQDIELGQETEAGFLEGQAEWSERRRKDYGSESQRKDKVGASKRAEAKRKQVREAEEKGREYATEELDDVIARFNLKPRGNTVSAKREAIRTYRKALESPGQTAAVNAALKGTGYKLQTVEGQMHLVPIDKRYDALSIPETGNKEVGQSTIDDYFSFIREDQGREAPVSTAKEQAAVEREAEKARARKKAPTEAQKEADQTRVEELEAKRKRTTTLKGRTTVVHTTKPGPLKSLLSAFKRKGQVKFHKQSQSLIEEKTKSGGLVDGLLKRIAGVYTKGRSGTVREQASRDPASILTLGPAADSNKIARAYALAVQYIFMRDSVSWIRPDNNLDIEASDTNLGIHVEFTRTLLTYDETRKRESNVRESQLLGQLRDIFGEDVSYTRLNDFEIILSSDKLSNINLARRLGRLRAKRDDIRKAELFTTKTETVSHNWAEDATGESIRSEIRELGFGDILAWTDDRRTAYLNLAEEFGATEVTQYRAPPRAPPSEATAPDIEDVEDAEVVIITDVSDDEEVSYSLAGEAEKMYQAGATIKGWKLFVERKDGTLGPLFINRKLRVPVGDWMPAEAHPTKGFAFRPQWHATKVPVAPHLKEGQVGSQFRVWRQVELRGITPMERPEAQGGTWFLANELRVPPVSDEGVAFSFEGVDPNDVRLGASIELTPEQKNRLKELKNEFPSLSKILSYLTPSEKAKVYRNILQSQEKKSKEKKNEWLKKAVKIFEHIPTDKEYAAVAFAGRAKKGWYVNSAKALVDVFGVNDAPRFASLLAALSPQTSVEMNLENTLKVWTAWINEGRPSDERSIIKILANNVRGANIEPVTIEGVKKPGKTGPSLATMFGRAEAEYNDTVEYKGIRIKAEKQNVPDKKDKVWVFVGGAENLSVPELRKATKGLNPDTVKELSVLEAWQNNSVRSLDSEGTFEGANTDPSKIILSGPKVDSFMWNLRGFVNEITSDTHMANFAFIQQAVFGGTMTKTDPGKGPGYLTVNSVMRSAAKILTKQTGETWTPAEIQETIWSWTKVLSEKRESASEDRTIIELANELTPEDIDNASDFADLFAQTIYRRILEGVPEYAESVGQLEESTGRSSRGVDQRGRPASAERSGFAARTYQRFLRAAAKRLEEVYQLKRSGEKIPKLSLGSLTPLDKPSSGGLSVAGLRRVLNKRFNKAGIAMLEDMGILKIVASGKDLPAGLITDEDAAMRARGLYYSKTGVAYLIANRLNATTAPKVLLHEVGTHFGLKRMLGNEEYAKIIIDLEAGSETTFKPWFDKVKANYRDAEGKLRIRVGSERFAEEVLAHIAEDTSEVTLNFRQRIWRSVRLFLNRHFGMKLPRNLSAEEIGYVIQGSLRQAMRGRLSPYMVAKDDGGVLLGYAPPMGFPEFRAPTRKLTIGHFKYLIANAIGKALTPSQDSRLRSNMDAMLNAAQRVYKKAYPNIDVHFPEVSPDTPISSRYVHFKNTQTGAELSIRVSDHPKDMFVAAQSLPFISYNNAQNAESLDFSEIDQAVKLLSRGRLDNLNGLEFQFKYAFGDGLFRVHKKMLQGRTYEEFLKSMSRIRPDDYARLQKIITQEKTSISTEEGPVFSIAPEDELTPEDAAAMRRTLGVKDQTSVAEWVNDARHRWLDKFVQGAVDAYRPIRNLGNSGVRAWQMMQLSENTGGMLTAVLNFGRPKEVYRDGKFDWYTVDVEGEGLIEVLKGLDGETNRFMAWRTFVRAKKLSEPTAEFPEGRESNFTPDEIKAGINFNRGKMADGRSRKLIYAQTALKMGKFQKSVLDMAVGAGVLDKATRDSLETDFYVPFYREFTADEKTGLRGPTPAHDFVNIKDVIHKLQGSEVDVHDVLHNTLMNWTAIMSASMKNRAGVAALEAAVKSGAARLLTDKKEIAQLTFSKGKTKGSQFDKYVYVLKDGKRVWYEVSDPLVLNAMAHMAWGGVDGKLLRVMSNFKRWLTIGVTASPYFKVRNLIRDTVHSTAVGKLSFNFFGNAAKGYSTLKNDDLITNQMLMGGGAFKFGFYHDDPQSIRMMLDAGIEESRILNTTAKIRKNLRPFWKWYADMGDRMENANRASLYMQRKEEVGHLVASFEARDLLNFSSHGRWVAVQWLTSAIPFLNARLQGLDKMARSGEAGSRARLLSVVGTVVLASILLRMSYEDDEDYNKLEEWQKNTYWPIKIPGSKDFFFLPKPFEIGAIASIGERITENFTKRMGTEAFGGPNQNAAWLSKYTWHQIGEIISDQLAVDWKPQVAKPVIEVWRNKNSFTNRYIENVSWQMLNVPREERVRAYSSEFAIRSSWAMGELLDLINAKDTDIHLSPVQVDHLIKGYFGWLGAVTTGAFDILDDGVDPQKRVGELFGSFYQRNPRGNSKHLTLFYDQMMEIAKLKSHLDSYKRAQKFEEARTLLAENIDVMQWTKSYERVRAQFGKISKRIGLIWDDKNMSPLEKEKEIDKLNQLKLDIATKTVTTRARIEAERGIMPSRSSIPRAAIGP